MLSRVENPNYRTAIRQNRPSSRGPPEDAAPPHEKALQFVQKARRVGLRAATLGGGFRSETGARQVTGCVFGKSNWRLFMNLTISGHHLEVTPALRSYVTEKLDRIMRHFDQVVDVKVLLTVEKQKEKERRQRAECNIHVKGNDMFAQSSHQDLYAAVDDLVDKLDRQVGRHKDRIQDHHHAAPKRLM